MGEPLELLHDLCLHEPATGQPYDIARAPHSGQLQIADHRGMYITMMDLRLPVSMQQAKCP